MSISGRSGTFCEKSGGVKAEWEGECHLTTSSLLHVLCLELAVWSVGCLHATYTLEGAHWKQFALGRQLQVEHIHFSICLIVNMHRITLTAFI